MKGFKKPKRGGFLSAPFTTDGRRRLDLSHSTVHVDFHTGDVRRIRRRQKRDRPSYLFWLSKSLHRHLPNDFLCASTDRFFRKPGSPKAGRPDCPTRNR